MKYIVCVTLLQGKQCRKYFRGFEVMNPVAWIQFHEQLCLQSILNLAFSIV